jgi:hypothetical protein
MAKRKGKRNPVQNFVARRQIHASAVDAKIYQQLATAIVTAGAEVLIEDHGMTPDQLAPWAKKTIERARVHLGLDDNVPKENSDQ